MSKRTRYSVKQIDALENLKWAAEQEGLLSNRPLTEYKPMPKKVELVRETEPMPDEFRFLAHGVDSLQECFNIRIQTYLQKRIDEKQKEAKEKGHEVGLGVEFPVVGEMQVGAFGDKSGTKYFLKSAVGDLMIRSYESDWSVSFRYDSAALWQYGVDELRTYIHAFINSISSWKPEDYHRLSSIHVCVDFLIDKKYIKKHLGPQILANIVVPPKVRSGNIDRYSYFIKSGLLSGLYIGNKASLEQNLYDKAREIAESSHKEFFYDIWAQQCPEIKESHPKCGVYRFENRFSAKYLRNRAIRQYEEFVKWQKEILNEAMFKRRICEPSATDKNRSRWAFSALFTFLRRCFMVGDKSLPLGRRVSGRRSELFQNAYKQLAGSIRSYNVLFNHGIYDEGDNLYICSLALRELVRDEKHREKCEKAAERYRFVDVA